MQTRNTHTSTHTPLGFSPDSAGNDEVRVRLRVCVQPLGDARDRIVCRSPFHPLRHPASDRVGVGLFAAFFHARVATTSCVQKLSVTGAVAATGLLPYSPTASSLSWGEMEEGSEGREG